MKERTQRKAIIIVTVACIVVFAVFVLFLFQDVLNSQDILEYSNVEDMSIATENTPRIQNPIPPNQDRIAMDYLDLKLSPVSEDVDGGLVVWIVESTGYGTLYFDTPQDPFTVTASNAEDVPSNLILKIFYNYEEVTFYSAEADSSDTELLFRLDAGYSADIPIQLSGDLEASSTISRLTVGLFNAPEHFVGNADEISDELNSARMSHNAVIDFVINYGHNDNLILGYEQFIPSDQSRFYGRSIYTDPIPPGGGALFSPGLPVTVRAGEEINLTLFANSRSSGEYWVDGILSDPHLFDDFIVVAMLDWHQIPMGSRPFMWVNVEGTDPSFGQHVDFSITAPTDLGFFEFSAFIAPNPTQGISPNHFYPLETFPRFTLEVIAD